MITATATGTEELNQALVLLVQSTRDNIRRELARAAKGTASKAKKAVPKGATRNLERSITATYPIGAVQKLEATVQVTAPHGPFVEGTYHHGIYGRRPGRMPPDRPIRDWVLFKRLPQRWFKANTLAAENQATFLVRRAIARKGTKAKPFFSPAVATERMIFQTNIDRILKQAATSADIALKGG